MNKVNISRKKWTQQGLKNLGEIISSSRKRRGLNLRDAAKFVLVQTGDSLNHTALSRIENGQILKPEFNTLEAITASRLVIDENGKPLTIYDFIDIASESSTTMTFKELLQYELDRRGWTLHQMSNATGIEYEDLIEVFDGLPPQEYVVDVLTAQLTNPRTGQRFVYPHEVIDFCQIQVAPNREVDQGLGEHANGIY